MTGEAILSYLLPSPPHSIPFPTSHNNSPANFLFPIYVYCFPPSPGNLLLLSCPANLSLACWGLLQAPLWSITAPFHAPVPRGGECRDQSGSFLKNFPSQLLKLTTNEMLEDFWPQVLFLGSIPNLCHELQSQTGSYCRGTTLQDGVGMGPERWD